MELWNATYPGTSAKLLYFETQIATFVGISMPGMKDEITIWENGTKMWQKVLSHQVSEQSPQNLSWVTSINENV